MWDELDAVIDRGAKAVLGLHRNVSKCVAPNEMGWLPARAWVLHAQLTYLWRLEHSAPARRWHAKCRTHSDCAVIRHKSRADGWECPSCGAPSEDSTHVYLECPAHSRRRGPLMCRVRKLCAAADGEGVSLTPAQAMAWVHTDSPALISLEAVEAGSALRRAAMAFYAATQQTRYCAHRAQAGLAQPPPNSGQADPHAAAGSSATTEAHHTAAASPAL